MLKLLVIKPSSLGDIVHALQVVQSMRDQMSEIHVTWVVREIFVPVVESCSAVDKVLVFERDGGVSGFIKLMLEVRKEHYDWVIDMQGLARSGLMTALSRADNKIGRSDAREFSGLAYNNVAPMPSSGERHAVAILLEFLPLLGLKKTLSEGLVFEIEKSNVVTPEIINSNPILVFPDSRRAEKEWGGFKELTSKLLNDAQVPVVCLGQKVVEFDGCEGRSFYNLSGKTSINDVLLCIEASSLVLCNDSGPMHLAAAMGKPVLALFGPTSPELYGPYPLDCMRHHVLCAPDGDLERLEVESVFTKVKEIMKSL